MASAPLSSASPPTKINGPAPTWPHRDLYDRVVKALYALPWEFQTDINIVGIQLTDLYTFNSALGAAIEQQVVENLNKLRPVWDPKGEYRLYRFVRQAQVFPDVRFQSGTGADADVIMGIELKGWFAMAKEGEPSFRYTVTPSACADADLLVVFPWILKEVISGSPMLLQPFVEEARFAAELKNFYWRYGRNPPGDHSLVTEPTGAVPYPPKGAEFNDRPRNDSGGNFGRVSRGGLMDAFITDLMKQPVSGIPLGAWQRFLKIFSESVTDEAVTRRIATLRRDFPPTSMSMQASVVERILSALEDLSDPEGPAPAL